MLSELEHICNIEKPIEFDKDIEKGHGRVEQRIVEVYNRKSMINETDDWSPYIKCFIKITRNRNKINTSNRESNISTEISYYISTKIFTAREFQTIIRGHRGIENSLHYVRDESMNEDRSRIRIKADNFIRLKTFGLNTMRSKGVKNVRKELDENRISIDNMLEKYSNILI